ncbi:MAG: ATP-binding protein [Elusimicrobiota bacterium]
MRKRFLPRVLASRLRRAASQFPVVVLTGPRQTGKSTLLAKTFPRHKVLSLDDALNRGLAKEDPGLFLEKAGRRAIIDEIQYAPELLSYIKTAVDRDRDDCGRFLLTGSQSFPLMQGLTESLAGRAAVFELLGFSWEELPGPHERSVSGCFAQMLRGFYPDPAVHGVHAADYYGSYLQTYLERDIRRIRSVQDLSMFQDFLELLAARAGGLLNLNGISREAGISHSNARRWLSLLETTRIVYLLRPYSRNLSKRVVKSPKLYFTDTGLLAYLLKYSAPETLSAGPMAGAFFENMMLLEFLKEKLNRAAPYELYFYRDTNGNEVDLVLDFGRAKGLVPVEIKRSKTLRREHARTLSRAARALGSERAFLLSFSDDEGPLDSCVRALPWRKFRRVFKAR